MSETQKNESFVEAVCQRGHSADRCNELAKTDFARAKAGGVGIKFDYNTYLGAGDCPCQASWAALYDIWATAKNEQTRQDFAKRGLGRV